MLNRKIRIGIDARCLNASHLRGMGKALLHLLRQRRNNPDIEFILFADEPKNHLQVPNDGFLESRVWEVKGHRFHTWEQIGLPRMASSTRCDILHCFGTWCCYWQPVPTVVTVHDVLPWREEPPNFYRRKLLPAAYRKAKAIITISKSSHNDICSLWPDLASKTTVIPWGIGEEYLSTESVEPDEFLQQHGVCDPYLLYFGGEPPRKRLSWAIDVWRHLDEPNLKLVLCGLANPKLFNPLEAKLRENIICLPFVPEKSMPSLVAQARAVLYPTLYEGFGFPALEAQAVGTPVLMSAVGSLKELAGPGATLLPTYDLDSWVCACRKILMEGKPSLPEARQWAGLFNWDSAFQKTVDVYKSVFETSRAGVQEVRRNGINPGHGEILLERNRNGRQ
jgi:glycosyltransferase involved in cell wall biosynthesis